MYTVNHKGNDKILCRVKVEKKASFSHRTRVEWQKRKTMGQNWKSSKEGASCEWNGHRNNSLCLHIILYYIVYTAIIPRWHFVTATRDTIILFIFEVYKFIFIFISGGDDRQQHLRLYPSGRSCGSGRAFGVDFGRKRKWWKWRWSQLTGEHTWWWKRPKYRHQ